MIIDLFELYNGDLDRYILDQFKKSVGSYTKNETGYVQVGFKVHNISKYI